EIADALHEARREALVDMPPVQASLFERDRRPVQMALTLATQEEQTFWARAERQLLDALREYASQAKDNSAGGRATQRRLFADDAAQGFAFIDLCRQRFDVVVMNPPSGAPAAASKEYVEQAYPRSKSDVFASFVELGLGWLHRRALLGAITSRTGF